MIQSTATVAPDRVADNAAGDGNVHHIPVDQIVASPFNPRSTFDQVELHQLADSLVADGQMQNIVVRKRLLIARCNDENGNDARYELVAGERRWRAAQVAGLASIRAMVVDVDDKKAIELAGMENYQRAQLNDIEQARWFETMIEQAGYTQKKLGEKLGITQAQVSQRLALLKLPNDWQTALITGVIPFTWARELAPWTDHPQILKRLRADIGQDVPGSLNGFKGALEDAIEAMSRPIASGANVQFEDNDGNYRWTTVAFKPTKKQKEELQLITVKRDWGGPQKRALNIELWDKLQAAGEKRRAKRDAAAAAKRDQVAQAAPKGSPAQKRALAKKQAEQLERKIYAWKIRWYQNRIAEHLRTECVLIPTRWRLLLFFACGQSPHIRQEQMIREAASLGAKVKKRGYGKDALGTLANMSDGDLDELVCKALEQWVQHDTTNYRSEIQPVDIELIADELAIDIAQEWELDRSYLELHTTAQLQALITEWKLGKHKISGKRTDIIDGILAAKPTTPPKALIKAKGGR